MKWWREGKFGLFIHWGLYAIPAGMWNGQAVPGIGEWIMRFARIPKAEYEQLAGQFNPVQFDADAVARLARAAGMKYVVITAKHHDGFAMYDSKVSGYDIVDATPYGRDPIRALAQACRREGLVFGFYYSQDQDWHEPDASGNDWDFDPAQRDFGRYLEAKVKPQVRELLTQYGPIGLIWFDTPVAITKEQSEDLVALVKELQPDCLTHSRVGNDLGDYLSMTDNLIPVCVTEQPWETPATLNDTWGYKADDHNWKPAGSLIRQLVDIVAKGGNYLLNIGPTAEGVVPAPSVERLEAVGRWMQVHAEAIDAAGPSPYPCELPWGAITRKPGRLYLHVFDWPAQGELVLHGLQNAVRGATLLGADRRPLPVAQERHPAGCDVLRIALPAGAPDPHASVIALEIEGEAQVDPRLLQGPDGTVALEACQARLHPADPAAVHPVFGTSGREKHLRPFSIGPSGVTQAWMSPADWLEWTFHAVEPGTYDVQVWTSEGRWHEWEPGHELAVAVAGREFPCTVQPDAAVVSGRSPHQHFAITPAGRVTLPERGEYTLRVQPRHVATERGWGLLLRCVKLVPAQA